MTAQDAVDQRTYTVSEVLALTAAKYKFVDHAIRAGYLPNDTAQGSGTHRRFTETEIDTIHAAVNLVASGITVAAAFDIGRQLAERGEYRAVVGSIYELSVVVKIPEPPTSQEPSA